MTPCPITRRLWLCATVASLALAASAAPAADAAGTRFEVLATFSNLTTGFDARGPLVQGADGHFYGVATFGGTHNAGTLFRVSRHGRLKVLHHFDNDSRTGALPIGEMLPLADGRWLGTTCDGGPQASGGIYRLDARGKVDLLRWFDEGQADAPSCAYAPLMRAADGRLYGTTIGGGRHGEGTVFSVREDGTDLQVLHSFKGGAGDGAGPTAGLIQASDGALYGTTARGGEFDFGAIYRLRPGRRVEIIRFMAQPEGTAPWGPLMQAADGLLYGTNMLYGPDAFDAGRGTVYRLDLRGNYAVVNALGNTADSPRRPVGGLVQAADGSLWGTSPWGGLSNFGSVYRTLPDGTRQTLHSFRYADGASPSGAPTPGPNGWWYGTTGWGGANAQGVVYRIKPGAP